MKKKIIKIIYIFILIISILVAIYLIVKPRQKEVQYSEYVTTNKIKSTSLGSDVKQNIYIDNDNTFRIMVFLKKNTKYDNLRVLLKDENNKEIFNVFIGQYEADVMYFEFEKVKKGHSYILEIKDEDGDDLELPTTKSNKKDYLLTDKNIMLQAVTYYKADAYNYLWYPMFLLGLLFTLFPFVWDGDKK